MTSLEWFLLDVYRGELVSLGFRPGCSVLFDRDDHHFGACDSVQVAVKSRYDSENHVEIGAELTCGLGHVLQNRVTYRFEPVPWILERK